MVKKSQLHFAVTTHSPVLRDRPDFTSLNSAIRNNPAKKEEVCRYLRSDIRVYTACEEVLPDDGGHN